MRREVYILKISFTYSGSEENYEEFITKLKASDITLKSFFNDCINNYLNPPTINTVNKPQHNQICDELLIELALQNIEDKYKKLQVNKVINKGSDYIYTIQASKVLLELIDSVYAKNLLTNYSHDEAINLIKNSFF